MGMGLVRGLTIAAALSAAPGIASGAANQDPDWPCIQRKVPELSLGQIWNGPELPAAAKDWSKDKNIAAAGSGAWRRGACRSPTRRRKYGISPPACRPARPAAGWRCSFRACSTT